MKKEKPSMSSIMDSSSKDKKVTFSKSFEKNGVTERITVEALDNKGYLIIYNCYGRDNTKNNTEYKDITKKYYSETNPLDQTEDSALTSLIKPYIKK
jgi:hypothetical protein